MHSASFLLRDVRNMKKTEKISQSMTSKDIGSIKDLKKARSSEQLINLNKFIENKNDKIKTIDQKLEIHQNQIEKNGAIIEQLTSTLTCLKNQFIIQKEKVECEQKKNKQLREEIQRTNRLLKSKNQKNEQLIKKLETAEKQVQNLRIYQQKAQELTKTTNQLRKQLTKLEQNLSDKKGALSQQNKQMDRYRDKINQLGSLKVEHQKIRAQIKQKQSQIDRLNSQFTIFQIQNQNFKSKYDQNIFHLSNQLKDLSEKLTHKQQLLNSATTNQKAFRQKFERLESENKIIKSQLFGKQTFSQALKRQLKDLKQKFDSVNLSINKRQQEERDQASKFSSMKSKIQQLQKKLEVEHSQLSRLKPIGEKMQNLSKKSKKLDELYRSMIPQIQCPYGHQLHNPVTVIPCGHNYCLNCKKGYTKQCLLCNGKLKIQAVYRNQLMDDIINIVNWIRQILEMISEKK